VEPIRADRRPRKHGTQVPEDGMTPPFTVALSVCQNCERSFGMGLWPWNGAHWTRTHGLCTPCHAELRAAMDDERPAQRTPTVEATSPAAQVSTPQPTNSV
jgi:hypothetical protein